MALKSRRIKILLFFSKILAAFLFFYLTKIPIGQIITFDFVSLVFYFWLFFLIPYAVDLFRLKKFPAGFLSIFSFLFLMPLLAMALFYTFVFLIEKNYPQLGFCVRDFRTLPLKKAVIITSALFAMDYFLAKDKYKIEFKSKLNLALLFLSVIAVFSFYLGMTLWMNHLLLKTISLIWLIILANTAFTFLPWFELATFIHRYFLWLLIPFAAALWFAPKYIHHIVPEKLFKLEGGMRCDDVARPSIFNEVNLIPMKQKFYRSVDLQCQASAQLSKPGEEYRERILKGDEKIVIALSDSEVWFKAKRYYFKQYRDDHCILETKRGYSSFENKYSAHLLRSQISPYGEYGGFACEKEDFPRFEEDRFSLLPVDSGIQLGFESGVKLCSHGEASFIFIPSEHFDFSVENRPQISFFEKRLMSYPDPSTARIALMNYYLLENRIAEVKAGIINTQDFISIRSYVDSYDRLMDRKLKEKFIENLRRDYPYHRVKVFLEEIANQEIDENFVSRHALFLMHKQYRPDEIEKDFGFRTDEKRGWVTPTTIEKFVLHHLQEYKLKEAQEYFKMFEGQHYDQYNIMAIKYFLEHKYSKFMTKVDFDRNNQALLKNLNDIKKFIAIRDSMLESK